MTAGGDDRRGLGFGLGAYVLWGLLPLYFRLVSDVGAVEIVAQRVVWSVALLVPGVLLARRWQGVVAALRDGRTLRMLVASAVLIAANWLIYVWAVLDHQVLAASLAYFLNPLINVALGVALLGERLTRTQGAAVALAAIGVLVLVLGAGAGVWISLALAFSFAFYGLIRKLAPVESLEGLTVETLLLALPALGFLLWSASAGTLAFGREATTTSLLILAGAATTVPLLLFAAAARRLRMTTLGLLQFAAPSIQFALAITVFGETLTAAKLACFACIWAGLAIYLAGSLADGRRQRSLAAAR